MPKSRRFLRRDEDTGLDEALENFVKHCEAKNLSWRTIETYEYNVGRFFKFAKSDGVDVVGDIDSILMEDFTLYLLGKMNRKTSVNTVLRSVRAFCNYCFKNGYIEDEFKIDLVKAQKRIKETYSDKEIRLLLEKPNLKECDFAEYRTWVIINWLLSTGNRLRTVRGVKVKDLDFESGYIKLRETKNKYQQLIPLGKRLQEIIMEYLEYRDAGKDDFLFCDIYGGQLSTTAFTSAVRRYNLRRGVEKTSSHIFRHTFAKKWIMNGGDIFRLQKLLGHKSLEMVKEYVNMFGQDLKEDFEEFNPLNEFSKSRDYIGMR